MSKKPQYDPEEIRYPDQHIVTSPLVPGDGKSPPTVYLSSLSPSALVSRAERNSFE